MLRGLAKLLTVGNLANLCGKFCCAPKRTSMDDCLENPAMAVRGEDERARPFANGGNSAWNDLLHCTTHFPLWVDSVEKLHFSR